jgi:hypothetical protein
MLVTSTRASSANSATSTSSGGGVVTGRRATTAPKDWGGRASVTVVSWSCVIRVPPSQLALVTSQPVPSSTSVCWPACGARTPPTAVAVPTPSTHATTSAAVPT